jgi:hypothetical protein
MLIFLGEDAPTTHLTVPPARAVAPRPSELILMKFLLVCIVLIFRVFGVFFRKALMSV